MPPYPTSFDYKPVFPIGNKYTSLAIGIFRGIAKNHRAARGTYLLLVFCPVRAIDPKFCTISLRIKFRKLGHARSDIEKLLFSVYLNRKIRNSVHRAPDAQIFGKEYRHFADVRIRIPAVYENFCPVRRGFRFQLIEIFLLGFRLRSRNSNGTELYHRAELAERGGNNLVAKLENNTLRLVTFNTGFGGLGEDADFFLHGGKNVNPASQEVVEQNMIGIERILSEQNADFLLLQEVDTDAKRSFHLNQWLQYEYDLEEYETRFALNYSCDYVPYPLNDRIGEVHSGIATYSRYDITSATRYSLPCPFSWPTRVANLKRCMLVTRIPIENMEQELVVVNFHLEAYDDSEGNAAQLEQMMDFLQAEYEKGNYVIAGGDFNQAFSDTMERYPVKETSEWTPNSLEELPSGWQYAYDGSIPTCRLLNQPYQPSSEKTQYYVIDGFIVSPNVTVDKVETLDEGFVYSDHNPVVLDITLE